MKHDAPSTPRTQYDVVVLGAGHAGIEAALAAARMGSSVLVITMDVSAVGRMSCNPAIGGTAKGQLVREIDALGGEMGKIADATGIHFRMLNMSKGPAVWAPRCQNDREQYSREAQRRLFAQEAVDILQDSVQDVLVNDGPPGKKSVRAVRTAMERIIKCKCLIVSAGTFLRALMHTGLEARAGGRYGEPPENELTKSLQRLGIVSGRLKTGTPPRIDLSSIDFSEVTLQASDDPPHPMSFQTKVIKNRLIPMFLTYTNTKTHEILRTGFDRSPMYTGRIKGIGPRYCPSIEDKISRFSEKERHQIFLEPEGYDTNVVYVNGFSTSLPAEVQLAGLQTIPGLSRVKMLREGYAVEYDYFPSEQLDLTLQSKLVRGIFFAGQVNGTSGYEEAAAQGLMAGINAAQVVREGPPFVLNRSQAYIGVLVDDLVNNGIDEPYRMFTSRAEYRLLLRQDNADRRLTRLGYDLGLISDSALNRLALKETSIELLKSFLQQTCLSPEQVNPYLESLGTSTISDKTDLAQLLKRPGVTVSALLDFVGDVVPEILKRIRNLPDPRLEAEISQQVEIDVKYEGYIKRQMEDIRRFEASESLRIPDDFSYEKIRSLSTEGLEKLKRVKPRSIGQAARISGVTPADVSVLMVYLRG